MKLRHWAAVAAFFIGFYVGSALAADVNPTYSWPGSRGTVEWTPLDDVTDTTATAVWHGGCGTLEVDGTIGDIIAELYLASPQGTLKSIDSDLIPNGLKFNSTSGVGAARFCWPKGMADINFESASSESDLTIRLIPD